MPSNQNNSMQEKFEEEEIFIGEIVPTEKEPRNFLATIKQIREEVLVETIVATGIIIDVYALIKLIESHNRINGETLTIGILGITAQIIIFKLAQWLTKSDSKTSVESGGTSKEIFPGENCNQ